MSAVTRRLVVLAGATVADPLEPNDPQLAAMQGRVGINLEPTGVQNGAFPLSGPTPDFWDVLVAPDFDASAFVRLYEAEMYDDGTIIVKRDLFGPGDYPHTWAGWPIPGDPPPTQPTGTPQAVPQTIVLTQGEKKALAVLKRKKGTK
jgi:hypothetical protein